MFKQSSVIQRYFPAIWYNIGWFGCIYFGKHGFSGLSLIFPAILITFMLKTKALNRALALRLLMLAFMGIAFDVAMSDLGFVIFAGPPFALIPWWMVSIWILFVLILPLLESLFRGHLFLAAAIGGILGPLSYITGEPLGVLQFQGVGGIVIYFLFWIFYFPWALRFVNR